MKKTPKNKKNDRQQSTTTSEFSTPDIDWHIIIRFRYIMCVIFKTNKNNSLYISFPESASFGKFKAE